MRLSKKREEMLSEWGRKCATLNESFKNIIFNYEEEKKSL